MKIHLVLDCLDYGDGVSNDVLSQQQMYKQLGYDCDIYTAIYDERMKNSRKSIDELFCASNDLLIHHYSGYSRILPFIKKQRCKKVMIYHNITPPEFVDGAVKRDCELGLRQLPGLKDVYDAVAGDSQFNLDCLIQLGLLKEGEGDVLPIPVEFAKKGFKKSLIRQGKGTKFLFVGRYVPNKKIEDIIDVFSYYYSCVDNSAKLIIVGNPNIMSNYTDMLRSKINSLTCSMQIELVGKISDEELQKCYQDADVFLCMSEHEGFCIPLLEAMWHGIPVFAYDAGAVRETMGNGGIVFTDKTPASVAHLIHTILCSPEITSAIQKKQHERVSAFSFKKVETRLLELTEKWINDKALNEETKPQKKIKIQMQGPFETSYSLAQVNRFLIEAMHKEDLANVSIHCAEGSGDYTPKEKDMLDKPLAKYLWQKEKTFGVPDVALRNMFPPVTTGLTAQMNFQSFGWEEDRVPQEYISWFNRDLDGIGTTSDFVTKALINSGLIIPVKTIGNGVRLPDNFDELPPYSLATNKKIKFLHISSAFPRKGVDVLLEAYFSTFTSNDDVCLVLKTFPNIHNKTVEQLKELYKKYPNGPEVEHIDQDLPESQLYGLYKAASCYVHCARGEGFGLPVAEAMLIGLPTIVCNNSGLLDFCTEDTCLTVGYSEEKAQSHLSENSNWYEPNRVQLANRMKAFVRQDPKLEIARKTQNAQQLISSTWEAVAHRWIQFINEVKDFKHRPTVDMVTTWNTKCGIAEFTRYYIENSCQLVKYRIFPNNGQPLLRPDEGFVQKRVWHQDQENDDVTSLIMSLKQSPSEIVHIQYNLGFFSLLGLSRLIKQLYKTKKVIITFHATKNISNHLEENKRRDVIDGLNSAYRIVVHQETDAKVLCEIGIKPDLVSIVPLGQVQYPSRSILEARQIMDIHSKHVVGSYGFLLPHKGIEKTIYAIALLKKKYPDILFVASCAIYDIDESRDYYIRCKETISRLGLEENVLLFTDFLNPKESIILLQSCDIMVMVYDPTTESASGAVRFCIAAKRPIITTHQDIFKEFESCSYQIKSNEPEIIAKAIDKMLQPEASIGYMKKLQEKIDKTSWHNVVKQYLDIYM